MTQTKSRVQTQAAEAQETERGLSWLRALLIVCILLTLVGLWANRNRAWLGFPDEAAYVTQADALISGHGVDVPYVQHFYRKYPSSIRHPEDHYMPGNGVLIAASFKLFGRSEFTADIPEILFCFFIMPLLTYALARKLKVSPPFAFCAAISVALSQPVLMLASFSLADVPFAACVVAAIILALDNRWQTAILSGLALAGAYYFKAGGLYFLPPLLLIYWMSAEGGRAASLGKWFIAVVAFAAACGPWFYRNYVLFGDPVSNLYKYFAATIDFNPNFYFEDYFRVWWGLKLPSIGDTVHRFGLSTVLITIAKRFQAVLFDPGITTLNVASIIGVLVMSRVRQVKAVFLSGLFYLIVLAVTYTIEPRFLIPTLPINLAIAWMLGEKVIRGVRIDETIGLSFFGRMLAFTGRILHVRSGSAVAALVICFFLVLGSIAQLAVESVASAGGSGQTRLGQGAEVQKAAAQWCAKHIGKDAVVMCDYPWHFSYYSPSPVVNVPRDKPDRFDEVVKYYNVQYIIDEPGDISGSRDAVRKYVESFGQRWKRLAPSGQDFVIYYRLDAAPPDAGK